QRVNIPIEEKMDVFVITLGEKADEAGFTLMSKLRRAGIRADKDYLGKNLKGQLKQANRAATDFCLIIGDDELEKGIAVLKQMESGEQQELKLDAIEEYLITQLRG
ncbi:MAG: histidine--tRNA ligase, partial [Clostridia bacterium]|nr:histidine--tRNA ligase [Clostridia bacterium]